MSGGGALGAEPASRGAGTQGGKKGRPGMDLLAVTKSHVEVDLSHLTPHRTSAFLCSLKRLKNPNVSGKGRTHQKQNSLAH